MPIGDCLSAVEGRSYGAKHIYTNTNSNYNLSIYLFLCRHKYKFEKEKKLILESQANQIRRSRTVTSGIPGKTNPGTPGKKSFS